MASSFSAFCSSLYFFLNQRWICLFFILSCFCFCKRTGWHLKSFTSPCLWSMAHYTLQTGKNHPKNLIMLFVRYVWFTWRVLTLFQLYSLNSITHSYTMHTPTHTIVNSPSLLNHSLDHSITHAFTWTQSLSLSVSQFLSRSVAQSLSHSVTRSLSHSVTQSLSHSVTQSLSHSVTQSFGRSVAQSLSRLVAQSLSPSVNRYSFATYTHTYMKHTHQPTWYTWVFYSLWSSWKPSTRYTE